MENNLVPAIDNLRYIPSEKLTAVSYWSSNNRLRLNLDSDMDAFAMDEDVHLVKEIWGWYWCEKEDRPRTGYTYITTENGAFGFVKDTKLIAVVWECDALYSGWGTTGPEGRGTSDARKPDAYTIIDDEIVYLCL